MLFFPESMAGYGKQLRMAGDAQEVLICAAVVAELADPARSWAGAFEIRGPWRPDYSADELQKLQCSVKPLRLTTTKLSRGARQCDYVIGIALSQMVNPDDVAAMNGITRNAKLVQDWFAVEHRLATLATALAVSAARDPIYDVDLLYDHQTFDTTIEATMRICR